MATLWGGESSWSSSWSRESEAVSRQTNEQGNSCDSCDSCDSCGSCDSSDSRDSCDSSIVFRRQRQRSRNTDKNDTNAEQILCCKLRSFPFNQWTPRCYRRCRTMNDAVVAIRTHIAHSLSVQSVKHCRHTTVLIYARSHTSKQDTCAPSTHATDACPPPLPHPPQLTTTASASSAGAVVVRFILQHRYSNVQ